MRKHFGTVALAVALIVTAALASDFYDGRRIVGGEKINITDAPWQVAVKITVADGRPMQCSGTLITRTWVLSAAHCFPADRQKVEVKTGETFFSRGTWVEAKRTIVHPNFNETPHPPWNDIALVELPAPATNADSIPPAPPEFAVAGALNVTGWGRTEQHGWISEQLMRAAVPYVDNQTCNAAESYGGKIIPTMLCAGRAEGGVDACQGDSGGPLTMKTATGVVLVGIVSSGDGCAQRKKYGVYTRVSCYQSWIVDVMRGAPPRALNGCPG